jgi:branched-chain amino acid transport system permease protein
VYLSAVPVPALAPTASGTFYVIALAIATLTVAIAYAVRRGRLGLALFAIHDDEDAAEVMGVPTYRCKLAAFGLSCALAGVAGGVHALFVSYVTAGSTFNIAVPLTVVLMSVLGGTRHWAGPALGAVAITVLLYTFTAADQAVAGKAVVGAVLLVAILFLPDGLLGRWRRRARRFGEAGAALAQPRARDARVSAPAQPRASDPRVTAAAPGHEPVRESTTLLVVRGLVKTFSGVRALQGVDLDVRAGEILGVLGPNGSGKSTLINVVSGHYRADAGSVTFEGTELSQLPAHRIARAGIARTYQIPRPFAHLSVVDNVALAARFGGALMARDAAHAEAMRWLAFTGLAERADVGPGDLNLHQTKFLELTRALAAQPRLLFLDEVLSGLAPAEIDEAVQLILRIRAQGTTVVMVEHVMRVITTLSDRIVVLDQGCVLAQGSAADVMARDDVAIAYLGRAHA